MELYKEFPESLNKINDYNNEVYENALERKHKFDKLYTDLAEVKEEILKEVEKKNNERTSAISNDMNL